MMPKVYRFKCKDCDTIVTRYRNAKRCQGCGGLLERETLSPWQRIMRAAEEGAGLTLSPDEVDSLSRDGAIVTLAENDDLEFAEGPQIYPM